MLTQYKFCAILAIALGPFLGTGCAFNTDEHRFDTYTPEDQMEYSRKLQYKKMQDQLTTQQIVNLMLEEEKKEKKKK